MKKVAMMVCLSFTSGCASFPQVSQVFNRPAARSNYIAPEISLGDTGRIARDMAKFLAVQLPPAKTTIELDPSGESFHDILSTELIWRGFGVVEHPEEDAVRVRYFVTSLDTGIVVRMKYNEQVAGRFYSRKAGQLFANTYVVRGVTK